MFKLKKLFNSKKRRALKGYMTLEASLIMPWVVFLFIFLIYMSFYLYDKCVLFQDSYSLCLRGSVQKEDDGAVKYVNAHMAEKFGSKYFGVGKVIGSVKQSGKEIRVEGECNVKIPFDNFLTFSREKGWHIKTEASAQIINPTDIIRKCRMAENLIKKAGGEK